MITLMKYAACLVLASTLFLSTGCVGVAFVGGAAAGITGAVWYHGALRSSVPVPLARVREAATASLEKLTVSAPISKGDNLAGKVTSFAADGKEVNVDLKTTGPGVTEITVRVGFWGDREQSVKIMSDITRRLDLPQT